MSSRRPSELEVGESVAVGSGAFVTRRRDGELMVRVHGLEVGDVDPAVDDSQGVFVVPLGDWFVALGEESTRLLRWRVGDPRIAVHELPRLSFGGRDDPVTAVTTRAVVLVSEADTSTLDLDSGRFVDSHPID